MFKNKYFSDGFRKEEISIKTNRRKI